MAKAIAIGTMKAAQVSKPGQHAPFSLGEVRRVRHGNHRDRPLGLEYLNEKDDPRLEQMDT